MHRRPVNEVDSNSLRSALYRSDGNYYRHNCLGWNRSVAFGTATGEQFLLKTQALPAYHHCILQL